MVSTPGTLTSVTSDWKLEIGVRLWGHLGTGQGQRAAFADGAAQDISCAEVEAGLHESLGLVVVTREGVRVPVAEGTQVLLLRVHGGSGMSRSSCNVHQRGARMAPDQRGRLGSAFRCCYNAER